MTLNRITMDCNRNNSPFEIVSLKPRVTGAAGSKLGGVAGCHRVRRRCAC